MQKYADAVAGKGEPLHNCFVWWNNCLYLYTGFKWVVNSHDTRVHGLKFQTVVLQNGLIINLEGQ